MNDKHTELNVSFLNPSQILNMGGPWIGDMYINDTLIIKDCVLDNYLYSAKLNSLYFVQYHLISRYYWYFSISFIDLEDNTVFKYDKEFDMLYLNEFISDYELEIFRAFHTQNLSTRAVFNIYKEPYSLS